MEKHLMIRSLLEKLIGNSFSVSIFFIIMISSSGFNLFEFHELITTPTIWALFLGYGIMSSIVIDFIGKFIPNLTANASTLEKNEGWNVYMWYHR